MKRLFILGLVLVLTALLLISHLHVVRDGAGGTLYQKGETVYLFAGSGHDGWNASYLKFAGDAFLQFFNVPVPPTDRRFAMMIVRVTPSGTFRNDVKLGDSAPTPLDSLTPAGDGIYARCHWTSLCKLSDDGFRPATTEEQKQFGGIERLERDVADGQHNGWLVQHIGNRPSQKFEINVPGKFKIVASSEGTNVLQPKVVIDLMRPGQPKETLYKVDGSSRWVSRAEYKRDFPPLGNK